MIVWRRPGEPGYEDSRAIWNAQVGTRPAYVATCEDEADVVEAVRRTGEMGLSTTVRGGGHHVAGTALCEGGVVISLARLRAVSVDTATGRVRVQGGARLADLDAATLAHRRLTPAGIVTETGVGGLTLGGGIGWTVRRFGLTCDSLVSVRLVTAAGEVVVADDERDPELMWALRGGGGGLGVVTEFEFATHPFDPLPAAGFVVHRAADAPAALRHCRDLMREAPDELTVIAFLRMAPAVPWIPLTHHAQPVVLIGAVYCGPAEVGMRALAPIAGFGDPVAVTIAPTPFHAHQAVFDAANPSGHRYYWKSDQLTDLTDEVIDMLADHGAHISSPISLIGLFQLGGAMHRTGGDRSCFPNRDAGFIVNYAGHWLDAAEDDRHRGWIRRAHRELSGHTVGKGYVNFQADVDPVAVYGASRYARLAAVKRRLDPDGRFRQPQAVLRS